MRMLRLLLSLLLCISLPLTATAGLLSRGGTMATTMAPASTNARGEHGAMTMGDSDSMQMPMPMPMPSIAQHAHCHSGDSARCDCALHCAFVSGWIMPAPIALKMNFPHHFQAVADAPPFRHGNLDPLLRPPSVLSG